MLSAVLVLLFLCGVHGGEEESSPDLVSMVTKLQSQVQTLEESLVQQQRRQVGFFASFYTKTEDGNHGPFKIDTIIKYKQVLTNVGNGYNAATGVFTAPVRGLYVFHFSQFASFSPPPNSVASLRKNDVTLAYAFDKGASDTNDSSTRVAVVTLEPGDAVYVQLQAQSYFYDYHGDHNSFSGFLLTPM